MARMPLALYIPNPMNRDLSPMNRHQRIPSDDEYLNEFHKKWNEDCMQGIEQMRSMRFSPEYLRAQSKALERSWREIEAKEREQKQRRKNFSKDEMMKVKIAYCNL